MSKQQQQTDLLHPDPRQTGECHRNCQVNVARSSCSPLGTGMNRITFWNVILFRQLNDLFFHPFWYILFARNSSRASLFAEFCHRPILQNFSEICVDRLSFRCSSWACPFPSGLVIIRCHLNRVPGLSMGCPVEPAVHIPAWISSNCPGHVPDKHAGYAHHRSPLSVPTNAAAPESPSS